MTRPTWATVVGVLGIIFGCLGILGGGQEILLPKLIEMQQTMISQLSSRLEQEVEQQGEEDGASTSSDQRAIGPSDAALAFGMLKSMQGQWEFPDWFPAWSVFSGTLTMLVSALYLLAAIWLLQVRPVSIPLFYWAAGLSIALGVLKAMVLVSVASFWGAALMVGGTFGVVIDVVLLIVVITGDKAAFLEAADRRPATESGNAA